MTPEQARRWSEEGILIVPEALSPSNVEALKARVQVKYSQFLSHDISNFSLDDETATYIPELWHKLLSPPRPQQTFKRWNIVADDQAFIELIDQAPVFDLVHEIMGPNIQLSRSQMIVIPAGVADPAFLHTDSGSLGQCFAAECCAPLMVSVQYFLTDLHGTDEGNFAYVPGSQRTPFPDEAENPTRRQTEGFTQGASIEGRVQVNLNAGDAAIFPHSLWHGASRNNGSKPRLSIILGYSLLFVRPYDYVAQRPEVLEMCATARQRRLLGDFGTWAWRPGSLHHPAPDQDAIMSGA